MKKFPESFVAFSFILILAGCTYFKKVDNSVQRILFVGNSLTYYNDLPSMVGAIHSAIYESHIIEVDLLAEGGISLEQHLAKNVLPALLTEHTFDIVVLQDFGGWPLCNPKFPACSSSTEPLSTAVDLVRLSGARPIWFSTYQPFPAEQEKLSTESRRIAADLNLDIVDVGAAMHAFKANNDTLDILLLDYHPNTLGSWVAAAAIVRTVLNHPLPDSLVMAPVCRQLWQESGMSADHLAATQKVSNDQCDGVDLDVLKQILAAANQSFITTISGTGVD